MRLRSAAVVVVSAILLTGCGGGDQAEPETSSGSAAATGQTSETPQSEESSEPTEAPVPSESSSPAADDLLLELPDEAMLAADELEPAGEVRGTVEGPGDWILGSACLVPPPSAVAMRTVTQGLYESTDPVGIQQVAVFATVDEAVDAAATVAAAMESCATNPPAESGSYRVEDVTVGTQGRGLANNYAELGDDAPGTYAAVTRRGNAVTVVSLMSGEESVGTAREMVDRGLDRAFDALCLYDSAGC
ncbi:hypothetical protein Sked_30100 [Sanguibacter keddieii DSM 10542]|uniref:Uncharacterized protein n=1 Tax=Sanguibacter keddieii (strain ATCC 51767 / DSM 10542 / NCFB 3025 / ST-74) TaxID=446469 RepID=D1BCC4_SANKS|nr:sensor domain-containing protein [Sanguibacter keddieii]ACZ22911.1 hypothetical protein Sked_30100 [Sanguibacter keddieii DSM 10542]